MGSIPKCNLFTPQHLTNTAWAFAELLIWNNPFMDAISAAASRRLSGLRFGDVHTFIWSLERSFEFAHLWNTFECWLRGDLMTDVLDLGAILPSCESLRS